MPASSLLSFQKTLFLKNSPQKKVQNPESPVLFKTPRQLG